MKALVIRNLELRYIELSTTHLEIAEMLVKEYNPELIIIPGNISKHEKRSILFAEEAAEKFKLPIVYSQGILEMCNIATIEYVKAGVRTRVRMHQEKTNVWWAPDFQHPDIEFREVSNWPIIEDSLENFRKTLPGRWMSSGRGQLKVDDEVFDDTFPFPFSIEEFNEMHYKEEAPTWSGTKKKILLTSIDTSHDKFLTVKYSNNNSFGEDLTISASGPMLEIIEL